LAGGEALRLEGEEGGHPYFSGERTAPRSLGVETVAEKKKNYEGGGEAEGFS